MTPSNTEVAMTEAVALKPCPFCNAPVRQPPQNSTCPLGDGWYRFIWCDNCDAQGGERKTDAEAIEAWNTRAAIEAMRAASPNTDGSGDD